MMEVDRSDELEFRGIDLHRRGLADEIKPKQDGVGAIALFNPGFQAELVLPKNSAGVI